MRRGWPYLNGAARSHRGGNLRVADVTKTAAERDAEHLEAVRAVLRRSHMERVARRLAYLECYEPVLTEDERRQLAALRADRKSWQER